MISAHRLPQSDILELRVAAPFSAEDFERVGEMLEPFHAHETKANVLAVVRRVGMPGAGALWEDLKLTRYIRSIGRVAILTDVGWYGSLAEIESALLPGIDIKRFDPDAREAALAWLQGAPEA